MDRDTIDKFIYIYIYYIYYTMHIIYTILYTYAIYKYIKYIYIFLKTAALAVLMKEVRSCLFWLARHCQKTDVNRKLLINFLYPASKLPADNLLGYFSITKKYLKNFS